MAPPLVPPFPDGAFSRVPCVVAHPDGVLEHRPGPRRDIARVIRELRMRAAADPVG